VRRHSDGLVRSRQRGSHFELTVSRGRLREAALLSPLHGADTAAAAAAAAASGRDAEDAIEGAVLQAARATAFALASPSAEWKKRGSVLDDAYMCADAAKLARLVQRLDADPRSCTHDR